MAAARFSSSPNSEFHKQPHSHYLIPSLTLLFVFLTAAVLGSPSMAASEPLIQRSSKHISNNPQRKQSRRDDRRLESTSLEVTSGTNHVSNNPPRKQRSDAESSGQRRRDDCDSKSPPQKQKSDSESSGRRRRDDSRFESAAHEVPSGPNPISN